MTTGICLATVTTADFLPGTLAMLGSFLRHHPGFDGDIAVIHDALPAPARASLETAFERMRFVPVTPELRERAAQAMLGRPGAAGRQARLHSLDAFRLTGYRKVLFCDSDMMFRGSVDELFDRDEPLLCCGDEAHLAGWGRDAATFRPVAVSSATARVLGRTFNAGFLLIDAGLAGERTHAGLLALVTPALWRRAGTLHNDQLVLNLHFAGRQTLVSSTFNYLVRSHEAIRRREGLAPAQARVLHFNGPAKPWRPDLALRWRDADLSLTPWPAFRLWYDAYVSALEAACLRALPENRRAALAGRG